MSKITKIEPQVKNKDRVNIYLDGEFKLGCSLELAMLNHFKNDVEISDEQLEQLVFENEKTQALNKAVTLLGKNLKTRRQMRTYLNDKGYSKTIVDYVLEKANVADKEVSVEELYDFSDASAKKEKKAKKSA